MTETYAVDDYADIARRMTTPRGGHRYALWAKALHESDGYWCCFREDGFIVSDQTKPQATFDSEEIATAWAAANVYAWDRVKDFIEVRVYETDKGDLA